MSRILILGGRGRVGAALARQWSARYEVTSLARPEIDASDLVGLEKVLRSSPFDILVNATALTNVDLCESAREEARLVNVLAPELMARIAADQGARMIHFSTDYVFDGLNPVPYRETDPARPLGYYGETKLEGEHRTLERSPRHLALRVSWVFGPDKPSFVDMIIERALAQDAVAAVADKTSSPTFSEDVADWLEPFLTADLPGGLYHGCNSGVCTWQEYGQYALDCAAGLGWPLRARRVDPLSLSDMKNFIAPRPPHSAMDTTKLATITGLVPRPWQEALCAYLSKK